MKKDNQPTTSNRVQTIIKHLSIREVLLNHNVVSQNKWVGPVNELIDIIEEYANQPTTNGGQIKHPMSAKTWLTIAGIEKTDNIDDLVEVLDDWLFYSNSCNTKSSNQSQQTEEVKPESLEEALAHIYGTDVNLYGQQRDGFKVGAVWGISQATNSAITVIKDRIAELEAQQSASPCFPENHYKINELQNILKLIEK